MFDEFVIFPWGRPERCDGPRENMEGALMDIRECGFNASPFMEPRWFDACRKAGLKIYALYDNCDEWDLKRSIAVTANASDEEAAAQMAENIRDLPDDVIAVYIKDEPGEKLFPRLRLLTDVVKKGAPGVEPYMNLFPNYAVCGDKDLSQLQCETYESYLDHFCSVVEPCSVSLDNYMLLICDDGADRDAYYRYFRNLVQAQDACKKYGIPFQHIGCCNQLRTFRRPPTFTSLAMQAYTALAAGAKVLSWYMYFGYGGYFYAPVDDFGEKDVRTDTWYYLKEVNRQAMAVGRFLFPMTFEEMYFSDSEYIEGAHSIGEVPGLDGVKLTGRCMVGVFDLDGKKHYLVVNTDFGQSLSCEFDDIAPWRIFDGIAEKTRPMLIAPKGRQETPLWIAPGCGKVICRD